MVRRFPVEGTRKPVRGARGPSVSSVKSHVGNREKPLLEVTPSYITRNSRHNSRMQHGQNCSFQNSIVFLKKKAAQAVLIQAYGRGFLARKAVPSRKAAFNLEREQNREIARRTSSATILQAFTRGALHRHQYFILLRKHEAVTAIQAVMRGNLQRIRWLTSHKISLRLLQIKRDESIQLEQITRDKLAAMESLDQQLEDFHEEQQEMAKQENLLDKKTQAQGSFKDQLRRENRQMRHKMDILLQKRKEIKLRSRSIDHTIAVATKVKPELEKSICQLESSLRKRQTALKKLDEMEKQLNENIDNLQDKVNSEHHQKESYRKSTTQLLQRLTEQCPNDRVLIAHCTALANNDKVALKVVKLQSRINESNSKTKEDIRSIRQWKHKQMKLAHDQVKIEFEASEKGQQLQRRHIQEYQTWLERRLRYCQRSTKQCKAQLDVAKAESKSLRKNRADLRSATKFLQEEYGKLQMQNECSKSQVQLAHKACQKQRRHLEKAKACEARELRRQAILRNGIQGIALATQGSSTNMDAMDPHWSDILSSTSGI